MASESIYDHPPYYEILFGWDRSNEAEFYHRTFERCGLPPGARVLEVACGTAQVARLLAARGWRVTGFDLRPAMVAFARERGVDAVCADMTAFATDAPFAAAYNPLSSFRLLHRDAEVDAHLARMAAALRPGAIYVLDLDLLGSAGDPAVTTDESWEMTQGGVTVRAENDAVYVSDAGIERRLAWGPEAHLRGYTATALAACVRATGSFEIDGWHPEASRATGTSAFALEPCSSPPERGRSMLVLRRTRTSSR
jgi:SAM-dependent methyltransferase